MCVVGIYFVHRLLYGRTFCLYIIFFCYLYFTPTAQDKADKNIYLKVKNLYSLNFFFIYLNKDECWVLIDAIFLEEMPFFVWIKKDKFETLNVRAIKTFKRCAIRQGSKQRLTVPKQVI